MNSSYIDLISVIIPVYSVERFIEKCIESVVNQTYKNLQIILVDDGSPDDCPKICDEWRNKDKRIEVIHKKNGGISETRNVGINAAKGEYIVFVDSDDIVKSDMIETLYRNLINESADISVGGSIEFFDENEVVDNAEINDKNRIEVFDNSTKFDNLFNGNIGATVVPWNKIYKKGIFKNIQYPKGKIHEDVFVTHHILDQANKIVYTSKILYYYRVKRNGSITSEFSSRRLDEVEGMKDRMIFFNEKYHGTKYEILSMKAYIDKIIRIYCLCEYNNNGNIYNKEMNKLKREYNTYYNAIMKVTTSYKMKLKYLSFKYFTRLFYIFNVKKYVV